MIQATRVDAWLIRGFERITDLVIQRSAQGSLKPELRVVLETAIGNLKTTLHLAESRYEPTIHADDLMFPLLLELTAMLLSRVRADKSLDGACVKSVAGYLATLETALARFHDHELRDGSTKSVE